MDYLKNDVSELNSKLESLEGHGGKEMNFLKPKELEEQKVPETALSRGWLLGSTVLSMATNSGLNSIRSSLFGGNSFFGCLWSRILLVIF